MAQLNVFNEKPEPAPFDLNLKEITELLINHHGLTEGLYDLSFTMRIALGGIGPTVDTTLPGASFGIEAIGLQKVDKLGVSTVDAATVKRQPPRRPKKAA